MLGLIARCCLHRQNESVRQHDGCEHHGAMWAQRMRGQIINSREWGDIMSGFVKDGGVCRCMDG